MSRIWVGLVLLTNPIAFSTYSIADVSRVMMMTRVYRRIDTTSSGRLELRRLFRRPTIISTMQQNAAPEQPQTIPSAINMKTSTMLILEESSEVDIWNSWASPLIPRRNRHSVVRVAVRKALGRLRTMYVVHVTSIEKRSPPNGVPKTDVT